MKLASSTIIFVLLTSGCADSNPGDFYSAEGLKTRKAYICERWDFFQTTDNLHSERDSIIQELEPGFKEMSELIGEAKFFDFYIAAQRYREGKQIITSDVASRISEWCQAVASGTD